jgi:hypothetical protein
MASEIKYSSFIPLADPRPETVLDYISTSKMVALINFSIVARNPNVIILSPGTMGRLMTKDTGAGESQTSSIPGRMRFRSQTIVSNSRYNSDGLGLPSSASFLSVRGWVGRVKQTVSYSERQSMDRDIFRCRWWSEDAFREGLWCLETHRYDYLNKLSACFRAMVFALYDITDLFFLFDQSWSWIQAVEIIWRKIRRNQCEESLKY